MVKQQSIFRSEEMTLCDFFVQPEAAYCCLSALGEMSIVQFRDLNEDVTAYQRRFTGGIRRCDEIERICRYVSKEINDDEKIKMFECGDNPLAPSQKEFTDLEAQLEKLEGELREVCMNATTLERNYVELTDMRHILSYVQIHTEHNNAIAGRMSEISVDESDKAVLTPAVQESDEFLDSVLASLNYVSGVISRDKIATFERMLWRVSRGNIYMRHAAVVQIEGESPSSQLAELLEKQPAKEVFIVFFQGEQLKAKINKICTAFRASVHKFPSSIAERAQVKAGIETRLADLVQVLTQTGDHRHHLLLNAASQVRVWEIQAAKIKAIYHELNKFNVDFSNKCLIGEGWCPTDRVDIVRETLTNASRESGSSIPSFLHIRPTTATPPTFFRTNKFTRAYQNIVHAYGVATYREINPALYTTITFPFLFAVMFGDVGHGIIMLLAALFLVIKEKSLVKFAKDNESFEMFFSGRYLILLMGIFSIYTGFIYNDIFSKSLKFMPSSWYVDPDMPIYINAEQPDLSTLMLEPANETNWRNPNSSITEPYAFGMDPIWNFATNEIMYSDSMKMKMSVIIGVIQMLFGLLLTIGNHVYFRNYISIITEFIPMLMFMAGIFIYMDILIIWKWIYIPPEDSACAPSVLIGVINMVLFSYKGEKATCAEVLFEELKPLQTALVLIAVLSIPWLLLMKPMIKWRRHVAKEKVKAAGLLPGGSYQPPGLKESGDYTDIESQESLTSSLPKDREEEEIFDFSEELIHQSIHAIEYCLGLVSHTASYLRLWALSLAHFELSQVLWMYLLKIPLNIGSKSYLGCVVMVPLFAGWAGATIGILVLMEGLSAFLHALRLHWVEFQSKFYTGLGYPFEPFSLNELEMADEE